MRVRLSTVIGLPIVDGSEEELGILSGVLLHPDNIVMEGIFVSINEFFSSRTLFVPAQDIQHWGTRIRIRDADSLSPLDELVRLQQLHEEGRPVLGQRMITEGGAYIGRCGDIQFDTRFFRVEWLFPRKWLLWKRPISVQAVVQVRPDAIVIRDLQALAKEPSAPEAVPVIEVLGSTPASRVVDNA